MSSAPATIRTLFERLAAKDVDGIVDLFDENAVFIDCTDPTPGRGHDAVREWVLSMGESFPDLRCEIRHIAGDDNVGLTEIELVGTHEGEFLGFAPTGAVIRWPAAVVYELDPSSRKIVREAYYYDGARLREQFA